MDAFDEGAFYLQVGRSPLTDPELQVTLDHLESLKTTLDIQNIQKVLKLNRSLSGIPESTQGILWVVIIPVCTTAIWQHP